MKVYVTFTHDEKVSAFLNIHPLVFLLSDLHVLRICIPINSCGISRLLVIQV